MVQEYKDAPNLAKSCRSYDPEQIERIAISVLEILVYLQNRDQLVIHRDIKPENILIDNELNAYLVDFGCAKIGSSNLATSTVGIGGTTGFWSPEQMRNQPLTKASDLYSLGVTLICLVTGTKSTEIGNLIDSNNRIRFKSSIRQDIRQKLSPKFINWLEKMVQPEKEKRFPNAEKALEELRNIPAPFQQLILAGFCCSCFNNYHFCCSNSRFEKQ